MMDKLLPCPFCNEDCATLEINQGNKWAHYEPGCLEVRTGYIMDEDATWKEDAAKAWNTRTGTSKDKLVAALKRAIPILKDMYSMELAEPEIMQELEAALKEAEE